MWKKNNAGQKEKKNAMTPLINSLQNAFWVTKCEKYSYCPHKNATLNEASILIPHGVECVWVFHTVVTDRKALFTLAPSGALVP